MVGEERTSRRQAPDLRRRYTRSGWRSLGWPQVGEFGWPPGLENELRLSAGMRVVAEINQGERTVLEYVLSPVQKTTIEAGRER